MSLFGRAINIDAKNVTAGNPKITLTGCIECGMSGFHPSAGHISMFGMIVKQ